MYQFINKIIKNLWRVIMKYKKDGIELSYTNDNDVHQQLVREVISEAIKVLTTYNRSDARSAEYALHRGVNFLKDNFDLWGDDEISNS
jgi:hypothetical protein